MTKQSEQINGDERRVDRDRKDGVVGPSQVWANRTGPVSEEGSTSGTDENTRKSANGVVCIAMDDRGRKVQTEPPAK